MLILPGYKHLGGVSRGKRFSQIPYATRGIVLADVLLSYAGPKPVIAMQPAYTTAAPHDTTIMVNLGFSAKAIPECPWPGHLRSTPEVKLPVLVAMNLLGEAGIS